MQPQPVQDRGFRGCWSYPIYEAPSAVQAVGSPGSTRVPQQPAKVNKLQLQHEEFYTNGSYMQIELRRTG